MCIRVLESGWREDAGETFTGLLYPVLKMDVKIEKGAEVSHGITHYRKLCLMVKYLTTQLSLLWRSLSTDLITVI